MKNSKVSQKITIVTVLYNSSAVIEKCLKSIPEGVQVYVVDNASSDGCGELAKKVRPEAKIFRSDKNLGFGRGNNLALDKVITEFALVLNPDTVMREDTLDKLLAAAERHKDAAIIAPTMYFENGEIQKTYKNSVFAREAGKSSYIKPEGDLCADCLSGAAMLLRMSSFKKIGFFDPKIFLFYEDDDICLKVRKAGYSLVLTPDAQLVHLMGKSSPVTYRNIFFKNWHMMWSRLYLENKYQGTASANSLAIRETGTQILKALGHLFMLDSQKSMKSAARLMAVLAFLAGVQAVGE